MATGFSLTPPVVREGSLHKQIADTLILEVALPGRASPLGVMWWSVDHAFYGGKVPGIRKGRGVIAGIPDLHIAYQGLLFLIEIKALDGVLSTAQRSFRDACTVAGIRWSVAHDAMEVLALMDFWGVPRAKRVRRWSISGTVRL